MMKNTKSRKLVTILIGVIIAICLLIWIYGNLHMHASASRELVPHEDSYVEVVLTDMTLKHRLRIEIVDYAEPVVIDYPAKTPPAVHLSDDVLSSYIATCNLVATNYDTFVSHTTKAFQEFSKLVSREEYQRVVNETKRLGAERGIDTSTKSVFLYKVMVSGEFGKICYLVGTPLLMNQDPRMVKEHDYVYTAFTYEDDTWKFEAPQKFREMGLIYLDYKDRELLRKLAASKKAFLDATGEKIERIE